jgi:hypothetical protein
MAVFVGAGFKPALPLLKVLQIILVWHIISPMDMLGLEPELDRMRADAMAESCYKLESIIKMLKRDESRLNRMLKISHRIDTKLSGKLKRKRKKILTLLQKRMQEKCQYFQTRVDSLKKLKAEQYNNVIMQREANGITEHSWINQFYG